MSGGTGEQDEACVREALGRARPRGLTETERDGEWGLAPFTSDSGARSVTGAAACCAKWCFAGPDDHS